MENTTEARAARALELSRQIKVIAETPAEYGSEHIAAQNTLANMAVELADIILAETVKA